MTEPDTHVGHDDAPPRGVRVMAIARWVLVAVMALVAVAALEHRHHWLGTAGGGDDAVIYYCPMHPGVQQDHPGDCPICSMSLVPRPVAGQPLVPSAPATPGATPGDAGVAAAGEGRYWCPMHPEVSSDDPETICTKCGGMKLLPRPDAGAAAGAGVPGMVPVTLTPDRIQLMGMRTAPVVRGALATGLRAVGVVAPREGGLAVVQTRFAGWVEELRVAQTGQRVTRGQVLAMIYSPDLLAAQQEHLNALSWQQAPDGGAVAGLSARLADDSRHRLELLGIARAEIATLERTRQPLRVIPVRAPIAGHVIDKAAMLGAYTQPGTALFQIADLSKVWVVADVHEHELARVTTGQAATIGFAAYRGETFTGRVGLVEPSLDAGSRTLRVRIELANPGLRLKPGMYGDVQLALARSEALVVPAEALVDTGDLQYVFLARRGGTFEPRKVTVGARSNGTVEVLTGVAEGDTVVTTANFLLDSESHLQSTIHGAAGGAP
jgi:Cu(I)/Ag(I) efflux system membrane fusion protein